MADFEESTRKTKIKSGKGKGAEKDSAKDTKDVVIQDEEEPLEGSSNNGTTGDMIDVSKPIEMLYCAICTMPPEFCEFGASFDLCLPWITEHCPQYLSANAKKLAKKAEAAKVAVADKAVDSVGEAVGGIALDDQAVGKLSPDEGNANEEEEADGKARRKRGGGAAPLRKAAVLETKVVITRVQRQKRKYVTVVGGLDTVPDLKIKDAARLFGKKFSSGSSIGESPQGAKEIVIQGDVWFDLPPLLINEFKIAPTAIYYSEDGVLRPYA